MFLSKREKVQAFFHLYLSSIYHYVTSLLTVTLILKFLPLPFPVMVVLPALLALIVIVL